MVSNLYLDNVMRSIEGWRGVWPACSIPEKIFVSSSQPQFSIINTNDLDHGDGHWILISRFHSDKGTILELYDSLAWPVSALDYRIKKAILQESFTIFQTNNKIIQHINSKYCGIFAIARAISILKGESLRSHLDIYTENLEGNSRICYSYIRDRCLH